VNGDGSSDVIVGAYLAESGPETDEGRAYVYLGSPAGISALPPSWAAEPDQAGASFGRWVSAAGDVNGDGFADVIVGAHLYDAPGVDVGRAFVYLGNEAGAALASLAIRPRQLQVGGDPIALRGLSDSPTSFRLSARGRTAAGRSRVRLEWQVAPYPTPLGSVPWSQGAWALTGAPVPDQGSSVELDELVGGLNPGTPYHWRIRIRPDVPPLGTTPIKNVAPVAASEMHLRSRPQPDAVPPDGAAFAPAPGLMAVRPNPFSPRTAIVYVLDAAAPVELGIYDAAGRKVATLVRGRMEAGRQVATWDGRSDVGDPVPAGVYFARLDLGGKVLTAKLTLTR
jgi:hypothetical protein